MEALFIYFLKANGLLVTFFLAYYFLLRKETFFNKNRWFLIFGLLTSVLLPLITFTKTVWVEPTPIVYETISNDFVPYIIENKAIEESVDWNSILIYVYFGISIILVLRFLIEVLSFFKIVSFGKRTKTKEAILIDNSTNENPFSFFKHIVFNSQMFSEEELQHIIIHENIHVKEKHSIDVLISKLFCAFFWINPIMWLYQKEMLQNLEYIADDKASTIAQDKINYQKTLLKVVTNQHQLSITNQFYQSLIKKRIVMLNTNQSNQKKSWKYALILPVLSAFMLLFQVETVAQEKKSSETKVKESKARISSDEKTLYFESKNDTTKSNENKVKKSEKYEFVTTTFDDFDSFDIRFEMKNEIINENEEALFFFNNKEISPKEAKIIKGNSIAEIIQILPNTSMIALYGEKGKNGVIKINSEPKSTRNKLYIINGKEVLQSEIPKGTTIEVDGAIIELDKEEGIKKYGQKAKDGVLIFEGKSNFATEEEQIKKVKLEIEKAEKEIKQAKIEIEKSKPEIERAKLEIAKAKEEIEKSKPEIEKAKAEIEKAKIEIEKSRIKMELDAQRNSKFRKEELEERRIKREQLIEERRKIIEEKKNERRENLLDKINYVQFILANGDGIIVMENNRIKIPEYPTTMLNKVSLYFNDKKISDGEFIKLNYDLIKSIKVINNEDTTETFKPIKEIYFYSK
jgi:beta-lactamase regulating signal transducer with metallopeptidase domain